ncbi:hypothetical protein [Nocardioides aquiterrae]|uniref:Uncharacterized protein n=1 Tax=Nocardioides aquiterrae TaxID=203799 RepID=A0ABP4EW80_9ACTN
MAAPDPVADRTGLWAVSLVIGVLVVWAATADLLGGEVGFTIAVALGAVAACLAWRDRITYDLVSNMGLVGVPLLIVGLSVT